MDEENIEVNFLKDVSGLFSTVNTAIDDLSTNGYESLANAQEAIKNLSNECNSTSLSKFSQYLVEFHTLVSHSWENNSETISKLTKICSQVVASMNGYRTDLVDNEKSFDEASHSLEDSLLQLSTMVEEFEATPFDLTDSWEMEEPSEDNQSEQIVDTQEIKGLHLFGHDDSSDQSTESSEIRNSVSDRSTEQPDQPSQTQQATPNTTVDPPPPKKSPNKIKNKTVKKETHQYLICQQKKQKYAVDIALIREILEGQEIQELPSKQSGIAGVIAVRGTMIPILDLDPYIGPCTQTHLTTVICEFENQTAGFMVDNTSQVLTLNKNNLRNATGIPSATKNEIIQQVAFQDNCSILVLELERLLT